MKKVLLALFVMFSFNVVFADGKIDEKKANISARVDKKIAVLNEFKSCVSAASEKGAIKTCRETKKQKMSVLREENKEMRKERKKERKAKRSMRRKKRHQIM